MPTNAAKLFDVVLTDDENQQQTIGRVEADQLYQLKVVSAVPEHGEFLQEIIDLLNAKKALHVQAPPPPDAPKFAVYTRQVERTSPDFFKELKAYLEKYYDLELRPAKQ